MATVLGLHHEAWIHIDLSEHPLNHKTNILKTITSCYYLTYNRTVVKQNQKAVATGTDNRQVDAVQNTPKELTPQLTPFLTLTAYSGCSQSAIVGNQQRKSQENSKNNNCLNSGELDKESNRLVTVETGEKEKPTVGFEPTTPGLQNQSSTIELRWHNFF